MTILYDGVRRLEADPRQYDFERGIRAEVADPAWMLGRQWQLGEHQGEDASSPVRITYRVLLTSIEPLANQPHLDPPTTPAEAIVESEPGDSWSVGRRVTAGRLVADAAAAAGTPLPTDDSLVLTRLPVPYGVLDNTGYDGRILWRRRGELGLDEAWFGTPTPTATEAVDLWNPAELTYSATFRAGPVTLSLERHEGGDLDWYSVDANPPVAIPDTPTEPYRVFPKRVRYPGAPLPRWFQIEDAQVDIGAYPPDRAHFGTLLLLDLISNQSDDWFAFAVDAKAGHIVTLREVTVHDSFGQEWTVMDPDDWSMFATHGLDSRSLVVWSTTATPLIGPVIDQVRIGIDEDANLLWAVEERLRGREVSIDEHSPPRPPTHANASSRTSFEYRPTTHVQPHWIPYVIEAESGRRRFVQGRAADLSGATVKLLPEAESDLLHDPASRENNSTHQLEPAAIPPDGLRVERRAILARSTTGQPVLWSQRRRQPLDSFPPSLARFDTLAEPRLAE